MVMKRSGVQQIFAALMLLLAVGVMPSRPALARGGGCFEAGTPILTPQGATPIERVRAGDAVLTLIDGQFQPTVARDVIRVAPTRYLEIALPGQTLRVTPEHPLAVSATEFHTAATLRPGERLMFWNGARLAPQAIISVTPVKAARPAYNLIVARGTYFAGGVLAHNKGCFLPETPILRSDGASMPIERARVGDKLMAFEENGAVVAATVERILTQEADEYVIVTTDQARLRVTPDHPFFIGNGVFKTVGSLRVGDRIMAFDGRNSLTAQTIQRMERVAGRVTVYNLQVDAPHTFFAAGVAVHNKGGCFPAGTRIDTPTGARPIEQLREGDAVTAIRADGAATTAIIQAVVTTQARRRRLETDLGAVTTTAEHPFALADGGFMLAGRLPVGGRALFWRDGRLVPATVRRVTLTADATEVFNLTVSAPHTFLADGFLVHNKGCFLPETPILRSDGASMPIERARVGDKLMAFEENGAVVAATVERILTQEADEYVIVTTDQARLRVTPDHPFFIDNGVFKTVGSLRVGDRIMAFDGRNSLTAQTIQQKERVAGHVTVYNLQVDAPHTFFAAGVAAHNKGGGCFLPETPILRSDGAIMPIERARVGDKLMAFEENGAVVAATVERILTQEADEYVIVTTDQARLRVTPDHPFFIDNGVFKTVGSLRVGDRIMAFDGRNSLTAQTIQQKERVAGHVTVYNLQVDAPHTFFAAGVAVHNKGGGYHHGSRGGNYGGEEGFATGIAITLGIMGLIIIWSFIASKQQNAADGSEDDDFLYPRNQILPKANKTKEDLEAIAQADPNFAPESLTKTVRAIFLKLQQCWQARNYAPMEAHLMPALYHEHLEKIETMIADHEINQLDDLAINRIDFAHVRYRPRLNEREVVALISATARDSYVDDRSGKFLRGSRAPKPFQEFWVFEFDEGAWRLRRIAQTQDGDYLDYENTVDGVEHAQPASAAPPRSAHSPKTPAKPSKVRYLLGSLERRDPLWNQTQMMERARQIFAAVYAARAKSDLSAPVANALFPNVAEKLRADIERDQQIGREVAYEHFRVHDVEIMLARNYQDNRQDEFFTRISAEAQVTSRLKGSVVTQDQHVKAFDQYWAFGRLENQWKLKQMLPAAHGKTLISRPNIDEEVAR